MVLVLLYRIEICLIVEAIVVLDYLASEGLKLVYIVDNQITAKQGLIVTTSHEQIVPQELRVECEVCLDGDDGHYLVGDSQQTDCVDDEFPWENAILLVSVNWSQHNSIFECDFLGFKSLGLRPHLLV